MLGPGQGVAMCKSRKAPFKDECRHEKRGRWRAIVRPVGSFVRALD